MGRAEALLGRCEQSIAHIKQAFALSPRDPLSGIWYAWLGVAEFCRGRLDAAIEQFKRAVYSGYPTYITYALLVELRPRRGTTASREGHHPPLGGARVSFYWI